MRKNRSIHENQKTKKFFKGLLLMAAGFGIMKADLRANYSGDVANKDLILISERKVKSVIILPEKTDILEKRAADELAEHLALICGASPDITAGTCPEGVIAIKLGSAADEKFHQHILEKGDNPSSFLINVNEKEISICGVTPEGTLFGVYELLEQIGVRWYIPGDIGRVIPALSTVRVRMQQTIQVPSMDYRMLQSVYTGDWPVRMRMGGLLRSTGAHGIEPFVKQKKNLFASNPECFGLVKGNRTTGQLCISSPKVFELALAAVREQLSSEKADPAKKHYIGMGPNDGVGWCECDNCRALDGEYKDVLFDQISQTDRYVWFFNKLLEKMEKEYPKLYVVWYAYSLHFFAPTIIKPHPRLVSVFAPITLDRIRGMDNPMSPDRYILRSVIDGWSKLGCEEMYYRGYYNNLACPQFPVSQIDRVKNEIPVLRQKGINVMRVEVIKQSWASSPLTLYVASKMMWDIKTDVDALLEEFYRLFYGTAAPFMKQYHEAVEAAFRDTPYFTGGSYPYLRIYDSVRRKAMRGFLNQAEKKAKNVFAERVKINRLAFDRLELFLDMMEARNNFDFVLAMKKMEAYYILTDKMTDYVLDEKTNGAPSKYFHSATQRLVWFDENSANPRSYFNRYYSPTVKTGYERVVKSGEIAAALPDEWDFLEDQTGLGEAAGYQRAGTIGGNWQKLKTRSATWSDQGLHYYKGVAWYRAKVTIPVKFKGRKVFLWFASVDEQAKVWVNGNCLGTSTEPEDGLPGIPGGFRPFDMHASDDIRFGEENTVAVRIENFSLDELGTGGIVGPVMFWSPRDMNWKP